jgi:hypothetical protein
MKYTGIVTYYVIAPSIDLYFTERSVARCDIHNLMFDIEGHSHRDKFINALAARVAVPLDSININGSLFNSIKY